MSSRPVTAATSLGSSHAIDLSALDQQEPEDVQVDLPPCTYVLCGRVTCGPLDVPMILGHTTSTTGVIASLATGMNYFAIGFGVVEILFIGGHYLVRKYGNISRVVNTFQQTVGQYKRLLVSQRQVVSDLQVEVQRVTALNVQLGAQNGKFDEENQHLTAQVEKITADLTQFRANNEALHKINAEQADTIKRLQAVAQSFKSGISRLTQQNASFGQQIRTAAKLIPALQKDDEQFGQIVVSLDQDFDKVLEEFDRQIALNQTLSQRILDAAQQQIADLTRQLSLLQTSLASASTTEHHLEEDDGKMQEVEKASEQEIARLRQLVQQYEFERSSFERERVAMSFRQAKNGRNPRTDQKRKGSPGGFTKNQRSCQCIPEPIAILPCFYCA